MKKRNTEQTIHSQIPEFMRLLMVLLLAVLLIFTMLLVNREKIMALFCSAVMIFLGCANLKFSLRRGFRRILNAAVEFFGAAAGICWILFTWYNGYRILLICGMFLLAKYTVQHMIRMLRLPDQRKIIRILRALPALFLCAFYLLFHFSLLATAITPLALVGPMQAYFNNENSFSRKYNAGEFNFLHGEKVYSNVAYGTVYPNSFMDIYLSSEESFDKPTVVFIHGGGYVGGTKTGGNPRSGSNGLLWYFTNLMQEGYNIVSIDYAYAPEYKYPAQLHQANQALAYLMRYGSKYGLNMDRVVLIGKSAGGNIAGMLALTATQSSCARELQIHPALSKKNLKAVVFVSALINNEDFTVTHNLIRDHVFMQYARCAFGTDVIKKSTIAKQTNLLTHVDENYPASYISDGNTATFYSQAKALHQKLDQLGVVNELNLYSRKKERLGHGYETRPSLSCAQDNMKKQLPF
jgi:acetyl esterase/lipase